MPKNDGKTVLQRFHERYTIDPITGCWNWTHGKNGHGYGVIRVSGKQLDAYKWYYELIHGPVAAPLELDHTCRNRGCVNDAHLEPVTSQINVLRGNGVAAINAQKKHCQKGHEYTPDNTYRSPRGSRYCRECSREKDRNAYRNIKTLIAVALRFQQITHLKPFSF